MYDKASGEHGKAAYRSAESQTETYPYQAAPPIPAQTYGWNPAPKSSKFGQRKAERGDAIRPLKTKKSVTKDK